MRAKYRNRILFSIQAIALLLVPVSSTLVPLRAQARSTATSARQVYYPNAGEEWERRTPQQVGMDAARLKAAVDFAVASEAKAPRDLELAHYQTFGREPFGEAVGPFKPRDEPTGIIIKNGYVVAEWGDPLRVDMTFSVTKSFISTVVGLAYDRNDSEPARPSARLSIARHALSAERQT